MAQEMNMTISRPDVDIREDVMEVFHRYPPLAHDRPRVVVTVENGVVLATGHVRLSGTRDFFVAGAQKVKGVKSVDVSELYDDDDIRGRTSAATPMGVFTQAAYGAVVLSGESPAEKELAKMVKKLEKMKGVRKVITNFQT